MVIRHKDRGESLIELLAVEYGTRTEKYKGKVVIHNLKPKVNIDKISKILVLAYDREFTREEMEAIYYLIELFLKNNLYYSYASKGSKTKTKSKFKRNSIWVDMLTLADNLKNEKSRKFLYLKSEKKKTEIVLEKLTKKDIILNKEISKDLTLSQKRKFREKQGLGERGPNKYFLFNFDFLENHFGLSTPEIYFVMDYLLFRNRDFEESYSKFEEIIELYNKHKEWLKNAGL